MKHKKKFWVAAAIFIGILFLLFLSAEIFYRTAYVSLPFATKGKIAGVRSWGLAGPALGEIYNNYNQFCEGDDRLFSRLLPGIDNAPVRINEHDYHLSTYDLGYENIGFRALGPDGPWDGVAVGDSLAFCWGVEMDQCWAGYLEEETGTRLANMSVVGTGSVSHLRYLEDYGWGLDPKIVLWQYGPNDPVDDYVHVIAGEQGCPHWDESFEEVGGPVQRLRDFLSRTFVTYHLVVAPVMRTVLPQFAGPAADRNIPYKSVELTNGETTFVWTGNPPLDNPRNVEGMKLTKEAILTAAQEAKENGRIFILLVAPTTIRTYRDVLPDDKLIAKANIEDAQLSEIVNFAQENGIEYIDMRDAFAQRAAEGEVLYATNEIHWSALGNQLVADLVAAKLQELNALATK